MARTAWFKLTDKQKVAAMTALPNHIQYWKQKETDSEFIPFPATWLNQGRWQDEITSVHQSTLPAYS